MSSFGDYALDNPGTGRAGNSLSTVGATDRAEAAIWSSSTVEVVAAVLARRHDELRAGAALLRCRQIADAAARGAAVNAAARGDKQKEDCDERSPDHIRIIRRFVVGYFARLVGAGEAGGAGGVACGSSARSGFVLRSGGTCIAPRMIRSNSSAFMRSSPGGCFGFFTLASVGSSTGRRNCHSLPLVSRSTSSPMRTRRRGRRFLVRRRSRVPSRCAPWCLHCGHKRL